MRRYPTLRPDRYARLVNEMITRAHSRQTILNVQSEAFRISQGCGIAEGIVARDVVAAAAAARLPMEFGSPLTEFTV